MLHSLIAGLDRMGVAETADAHCDIPCKIYDPSTALIAALSVVRIDREPQHVAQQINESPHAFVRWRTCARRGGFGRRRRARRVR